MWKFLDGSSLIEVLAQSFDRTNWNGILFLYKD